jgi:hypothetical protein
MGEKPVCTTSSFMLNRNTFVKKRSNTFFNASPLLQLTWVARLGLDAYC